ncbi:MAG: aminopeptidase P family protein [Candidatus Aminicenantes bacterium]|nr:MAG: aminopeptidase P family protein [Candidatus Aminicenantes bacterium]
MFSPGVYQRRRQQLKKLLSGGVAIFIGNEESPMNYPANPYPFRQDSSFLYFFGLDEPSVVGVVDVDQDREMIFGHDITIEDIIWMGELPTLKERGEKAGVSITHPLSKLPDIIAQAVKEGRKVHFLPPYRAETTLKISDLLGLRPEFVRKYASAELVKAVVALRSIKSSEEIEAMEKAHEVTYQMYIEAMSMARPGRYEQELAGRMEGICVEAGCLLAFPIILTINGQILHNHYHGNELVEGRLLVMDGGAESPEHYAADITRTVPVGGKFNSRQKDIYSIVLKAQEEAIAAMKPGVYFRDVHLQAAKIIAEGLKDLGLLKGEIEDIVQAGAHALFFPHGLGHMIGLDVHDMEDLGEDFVGYDEKVKRSDQFGLAYLRMAKKLEPNNVLTVEPGIYFIPALIEQWAGEKKHSEFVNYEQVKEYLNFGGVRIEDDVLITETGHRVLGRSIPKKIEDVEEITATK